MRGTVYASVVNAMASWRLTFKLLDNRPPEPDQCSVVLAEGQRCTFGRGQDVTVRFNSGATARTHCFITVSNGEAMIEDSGSSNGTWLNGKRVARATKIVPGDKVHAGQPGFLLEAIEPVEP
jgi:pSer/pThr/pTyr-binding forkhead associated (FHA) protein